MWLLAFGASVWIATAICSRLRSGAAAWAAMEQPAEAAAEPAAVADSNDEVHSIFDDDVLSQFDEHVARLSGRAKARRYAVQLRSAVLDNKEREHTSELDMLGKRQPQDEYQGDVNLRTLHSLLRMVDERGFERSAHQASRCTALCLLLSY